MRSGYSLSFFFFIISILPALALARLEALEDEELSQYVGQAFIAVDKDYSRAEIVDDDNNPTGQLMHPGLTFTRITLGAVLEQQITARLLRLGRYDRVNDPYVEDETFIFCDVYLFGSCLGDQTTLSAEEITTGELNADLYLQDYTLGDFAGPNGDTYNGVEYGPDEVIPFVQINPFFEFAFEEDADPENRRLVGFRFGAENTSGRSSALIRVASGNILSEITFTDDGGGLNVLDSQVGNKDKPARAVLSYTTSPDCDFNCEPGPLPPISFTGPNGEIIFPGGLISSITRPRQVRAFQSVNLVDTPDYFISFQTKELWWNKVAPENAQDDRVGVRMPPGFAINVPRQKFVSLGDALGEFQPRQRGCLNSTVTFDVSCF